MYSYFMDLELEHENKDKNMPLNIHIETFINKPVDEVWKVFMDFPSYPKWNPFLVRIEQQDDDHLLVVFGDETGEKRINKMEILKLVPNEELTWRGKLGGTRLIFSGDHYFKFRPENGGTVFTHGENFTGILAYILWPFINKMLNEKYLSVNEALKKRTEES